MCLNRFANIFLCLILNISIAAHAEITCDLQTTKASLQNYHWLAEDYPPYNFVNDQGEITGIFTDTLVQAYQMMGLHLDQNSIDIVPWARLYRTMENDASYAAFSMVNTAERVAKFQLIPLPIIAKVSIIVLANRYEQLKLKPLEELVIAVVRDDIGQHLLNKHNVGAKQVETTSAYSMLKMLVYKRVDAIAYAEDVASFQYDKLAITQGSITTLQVLDDTSFNSYVFHKKTDHCIISLLTQTIDRLFLQGEIAKTRKRYLQN